ncbi:hypothetical protein V8C40DRAFT_269321 [Trichoderma camerunense]
MPTVISQIISQEHQLMVKLFNLTASSGSEFHSIMTWLLLVKLWHQVQSQLLEDDVPPHRILPTAYFIKVNGDRGVVSILLEDGRVDHRGRNGRDDRADPNERNGRDETLLGLAVQRCRQEVVRLFLDDDRVDPNGKHINGMTPLLAAGSSGQLQSVHVINMLLEDSWVDGHARDDDGCNACVLAAKHIHGKIIAGLLPTLHDAGNGH